LKNLRRAAVRRADRHIRGDLVEDPGDADHEELVEVRREDAAELDPLEQRLVGVGGEIEDALVEVEPRELAVQKRAGGGVDRRHGLR
jgi:hypothetical protein